MTDNALVTLIRAALLTQLATQGQAGTLVLGSYQPTAQGRESGPAVYFFCPTDERYGWQGRTGVYNSGANAYDYTERQWHNTTFQLGALAPQDPANLTLPTPKDIVALCAMIVNGSAFRAALRAQAVGVQRVTTIRQPYFVNDREQFEASPSFDFTVSHRRTIIQQAPAVESVEVNSARV